MTRTRTSLSALQRPLRGLLLGLALVCAGFAANAQSIGRLNLQQGTVSVSSAGDDRWSAARPGRELGAGDRIWTDRNARAEVYIGPAALRLDGGTYVEFTGIDEDTIRINAGRGNLQLSVRDMAPGQRISIDTPNLSAVIGAPGEYRIAVDEADTTTTWAAVASGHLTLRGQNGISQLLTGRQQTTVSGRNLTTVRTTRSQNGSFDTWVAERGRYDDPVRYAQPAVAVPPAALIARQQQIEYEQARQQAQWMEQQRAAQAAQQQQLEWQREQDWRQQQEWRRQEDWRQRREWRDRAEQDRWQQQQQLQLQLQQQQRQALRQQQEMQQRAAQAQALQQQQLLQQQQAAQMQLQQQRAAQQQALAQQQMLRQQQELQQRTAQMQQQAQAQQQALQQAQLRALQQQRGTPPQPGQPAGDDPRRLWTSPDSRQ
ncbi:hypothetical protein EJP67_30655 [Variovorax guangxiensis]|uniref:FecR protein domain-containing protein n=1 Tax=Variovorax guangxiensis TaxID=1775474 RepID=A0A3S0ZJ77_9BURK|nr:hypothetical protein [Variovorax guangxiensis]RUR71416.1 hypothetical protein EJP67_30655 [Variovorax guangxiensis]